MRALFLSVLSMSAVAAVVIAAVLLARLLLRRAPKVCSYALWAVVLFRLLCPVTLESRWSPVPSRAELLPEGPATVETVQTAPGAATDAPVNAAPSAPSEVLRPAAPESRRTTDWAAVGAYLWPAGMAALLAYSLGTLLRLRRRLVGAVRLRDNIYLADHIQTPFVMGLLRPKIYLPSGLSAREQDYIIRHERHHIRRGDHLFKLLAFAALCVHWFNPLAWCAFILAGRDMEMSCDEAVMKQVGGGLRADYSASLLSLATGRRIIAGAPLAFGEGDPKARIKNVLRYKKPAFWVTAAGVTLAAALCVVLALDSGRLSSARELERDARAGMSEEDWSLAQGMNDRVAALLLYGGDGAHRFRIYINDHTVLKDYVFRRGGSDSAIDRGVKRYVYGDSLVLLSMNAQRVASYAVDGGDPAALDPARPFALVTDRGPVELWDEKGAAVEIADGEMPMPGSDQPLDGTYAAGRLVGQNVRLSFAPADGGSYGGITLRGGELTVAGTGGEPLFQGHPFSYITGIQDLPSDLTQGDPWLSPLSGFWDGPTAVDRADIPSAARTGEVLVLGYGDQRDAAGDLLVSYSVYCVDGQPFWFAEGTCSRIYELEAVPPTPPVGLELGYGPPEEHRLRAPRFGATSFERAAAEGGADWFAARAANADLLAERRPERLPVIPIDSAEDLTALLAEVESGGPLGRGVTRSGETVAAAERYGADFFEEHTLLALCAPAVGGDVRVQVSGVRYVDGALTVEVLRVQRNGDADTLTDRFLFVELRRDAVADCRTRDAQYR